MRPKRAPKMLKATIDNEEIEVIISMHQITLKSHQRSKMKQKYQKQESLTHYSPFKTDQMKKKNWALEYINDVINNIEFIGYIKHYTIIWRIYFLLKHSWNSHKN